MVSIDSVLMLSRFVVEKFSYVKANTKFIFVIPVYNSANLIYC